MLLCMSGLFVACQSVKMVPDLYELAVCGSGSRGCAEMLSGAINSITRLSHLLVCANSAANFLVYYLR